MLKKFNITDMNLYKSNNRFLKSFFVLKNELNRLPTIEELSSIDHMHYNGINTVNFAIKSARLKANSCVLDIGSGVGGPARYISYKTRARVYALEIQESLNEIGKYLTDEYNLNKKVKHIQKDILFYKSRIKFDCAVSWLALYHIPNHDFLFNKISSLLKVNGIFFSEDFFLKGNLSDLQKINLSKNFYANYLVDYKKYLNDLKKNGFKIISHKNMTDNWTKFTKKRLESYKSNMKKNSKLLGVNTCKKILKFYELAHELLAKNILGGIRFICKKK